MNSLLDMVFDHFYSTGNLTCFKFKNKNNVSEIPPPFEHFKKVVLFSPTLNIIGPQKNQGHIIPWFKINTNFIIVK
ncbi:hypothetical protein A0U40_08500 [[Bacillus] sp. KCTC 13219]|nr:hypothetical protein A0U40_08500 [[Bacillus] sp. KCTC 13219]